MSDLGLKELIRSVRNCKTAQEERTVIAKECAAIRKSLAEQSPYRARNVAKLMYIHMLGYPTHFGQMECITLISSPEYPEKRIGYLGLMMLLDEDQEVLPLVEHSLKKDLDDTNQFVQAMALTTIANIASADICRDLSPEVEKLFIHAPSYIRKKAALCGMRMVKKCPHELADNYVEKLDIVLTNEQHQRNHGAMLTCISLILELCRIKDDELRRKYTLHFRRYIPVFAKILKGLSQSTYALEHDVGGVADPFLQTAILKLLRVLAKGSAKASEAASDILSQIATNTDSAKNAGNSILYECARTVLDVESEKGLRSMAINQLGKFLVSKDNNLRYVALHTMSKVAEQEASIISRHLNTIVSCLKDYDNTIRMRALDLIYLLMNRDNVVMLTDKLIQLLQELSVANQTRTTLDSGSEALRENLTTKLCTLVEKHGPSEDVASRRWKLETFLKIITISGQFVREEIASIFIGLITQSPELQAEFTLKLFNALRKFIPKPHLITKLDTLVQVAVWCIGEFGDLVIDEPMDLLPGETKQTNVSNQEVLRVLERVMDIVNRDNTTTRSYILTSTAKFCSRSSELFASQDSSSADSKQPVPILKFLNKYRADVNLELQQRSCEYTKLFGLNYDLVSNNILERMPVIEVDRIVDILMAGEGLGDKKFTVKRKGEEEGSDESVSGNTTPVPREEIGSQQEEEKSLESLLISFDEPVVSVETSATTSKSTKSLLDLDSLFDNLSSAEASTSPPTPIATPLVTRPAVAKATAVTPTSTTPSPVLSLDELMSGTTTVNKFAGAKTVSVYSKNGVIVRMMIKQNDPMNQPDVTHVVIQFGNSSDSIVSNLSFLCAVPKHVKLQIFKVSSERMGPKTELGAVTQKMKWENPMYAQRPVNAVKYQIKYTLDNTNISDQGTVQV